MGAKTGLESWGHSPGVGLRQNAAVGKALGADVSRGASPV